MSDELIELPDGWVWTTLDEIMKKIVDGTHHTPTYVDDGIPFLSVKDIRDGQINFDNCKYISAEEHDKLCQRCHPEYGDLLITKSGTIGRCAVVQTKRDFSLFVSVALLKPATSEVNISFISLAFQSWFQSINVQNDVTGTAIKNFHLVDFRKLALPLPPLNEQKRIVAKIEALNDRTHKIKEALDSIPQLCDRFRQSVLAAAFRGDLTADWREQNPDVEPASVLLERIRLDRRQRWEEEELTKFKASGTIPTDEKWKSRYKEPHTINHLNLPELPNAWSWASVEQFANVGTGATPLRNEPKYYENGIIPWITSGALNSLFIDKAEEFITPIAIQETNAKVFPKHTLLVAMYGEGKTRGKVAELLIEAATNQACAALILEGLSSKIQPLVKLFFQKNYNDIRKLASGGVQPNLNLSMIKSTLVPIPPLQEQVEIIQVVSHLMSMIEIVEKQYQYTEDKLDHFNQSILAKAFRGELVPQDPDDEPASVLLERIRPERDKLNNSKPKSQRTSKRKSKTPEGQVSIPGLE